jgi:glycosyltransferase involved in cell wall biosynthesis
MYITFFHNYRWGWQIRGDERGLFEKAKRFRDMGIDLFLLEKQPSFQDDIGEKVYTSLKLNKARIPPQSLKELTKLVVRSVFAVLKKKGPLHPVAVYAYNQDIENVLVGYILKFLIGSKLVIVYHQITPKFVAPFWPAFFDRRSRGFSLHSAFLRSMLPAINRYALEHADLHIAISKAAKQDAIDYLGITKCVVAGNGLDTKRFRPLDLPKTYDAAFFGRIAPQKGIDILLKSWRIVVNQFEGAKLILIGGGEKEDVETYQQLIRELGLENNTMMTGFKNDEEVVRLLSSSKIYVFPSRKEGFAQTVSQAMACDMCCVLSDIPALTENYGAGAIYVPVDNVEALASTIINLLEDDSKRQEYSNHAREHVMRFNWEDVTKNELTAILGHSPTQKFIGA